MALNISLIRKSFAEVAPFGDQLSEKFFEFLQEDFPRSNILFTKVAPEQKKRILLEGLKFCVENFDNTEALVNYLEERGASNKYSGVEASHYGWVGSSLLKTLAFHYKRRWSTELKVQWSEAYTVISTSMQRGAEKVREAA